MEGTVRTGSVGEPETLLVGRYDTGGDTTSTTSNATPNTTMRSAGSGTPRTTARLTTAPSGRTCRPGTGDAAGATSGDWPASLVVRLVAHTAATTRPSQDCPAASTGPANATYMSGRFTTCVTTGTGQGSLECRRRSGVRGGMMRRQGAYRTRPVGLATASRPFEGVDADP